MAKSKTEQQKAVTNAAELKAMLNERYGKGTMVGGNDRLRDYDVVSTGSIELDEKTGCGGYPVGKLVELFGPESSGKSTMVLHAIAEFQKTGRLCALFDHEHSFDSVYAEEIGVKVDDVLISQSGTMEESYNAIYDTICSGLVGLIVLDSHTSMIPKQKMESKIGDAKVAPEARVNSDAIKMIHAALAKYKCTMIGISQLRSAVGDMVPGDKPTGGNAWKFYSDMRIKVFKQVDREQERNDTTIEIVKNKCGNPFGKCKIPIAWGIGIDKQQEVINLGAKYLIIDKAGSWYSYNGSKIGQGADKVKEFFDDNPAVYEEIRAKVIEAIKKEDEESVIETEEKEEVV